MYITIMVEGVEVSESNKRDDYDNSVVLRETLDLRNEWV